MRASNTTIGELEKPAIGRYPENFWPLSDLLPGVELVSWAGRYDDRPRPDLSDCRAERLPGRPWLLQLWEPLLTKAPSPSRCQPYCCYSRTVIFYHRPYIPGPRDISRWLDGTVHVSSGSFAKFDQVDTRLSWDDVVGFDGDRFVIGGGQVRWHHQRWWMHRTARRQQPALSLVR
jgi:hypothetical protein